MSGCNCGSSRVERLNPAKPGKLGRCRFCIVSSLLLAVAGWAASLAVLRTPGLEVPGYATLAAAVAATLLFSAHVGAIVIRRIESSGASLNTR